MERVGWVGMGGGLTRGANELGRKLSIVRYCLSESLWGPNHVLLGLGWSQSTS